MSIATQVLESLFENRYNFVAPDSGPHKLPYTCSFHWFYTPEGELTVPGQSISEASFLLRLKVLVPGKGTGEAGLLVANMNAMDYLRVEFSGWISVNGQRTELDRIVGYTSVHFGDFLPNYAAVAYVPPDNPQGSGILVNVTDKEDLRAGGELLNGRSAVYGYGSGLIPRLFVTVADLHKGVIPLGHAQLELSKINGLPHRLLGRDTVTAVANARHVSKDGKTVDLGQVILDFRAVIIQRFSLAELGRDDSRISCSWDFGPKSQFGD